MAYDPTIPALNNYVGDDIPKIMANFVELAGSRIVEMGSNANGQYVRWENGLQLCWHNLNLVFAVGSSEALATWTYPAAFSDAPHLSVTDRPAIGNVLEYRGTEHFTNK